MLALARGMGRGKHLPAPEVLMPGGFGVVAKPASLPCEKYGPVMRKTWALFRELGPQKKLCEAACGFRACEPIKRAAMAETIGDSSAATELSTEGGFSLEADTGGWTFEVTNPAKVP